MCLKNKILDCQNCELYKNQLPLLDTIQEADVMWVGISAKKVGKKRKEPLAIDTNTGIIIRNIMDKYPNLKSYRTNLVKCVPLDLKKKLRYPTNKEMHQCRDYIKEEIEVVKPKVVFLLGLNVAREISKLLHFPLIHWDEYNYEYAKYNDIYFVTIQHPSYISTYKKGDIVKYINGISNVIEKICGEE